MAVFRLPVGLAWHGMAWLGQEERAAKRFESHRHNDIATDAALASPRLAHSHLYDEAHSKGQPNCSVRSRPFKSSLDPMEVSLTCAGQFRVSEWCWSARSTATPTQNIRPLFTLMVGHEIILSKQMAVSLSLTCWPSLHLLRHTNNTSMSFASKDPTLPAIKWPKRTTTGSPCLDSTAQGSSIVHVVCLLATEARRRSSNGRPGGWPDPTSSEAANQLGGKLCHALFTLNLKLSLGHLPLPLSVCVSLEICKTHTA